MLKDEGYLLDMLNEARKLLERFRDSSRGNLDKDTVLRDATLWSLTVMGEAATKVSQNFRTAHPQVPWRQIIGLRNVLVHNYAEIDFDIVWDIIHDSVPRLVPLLDSLIPKEDDR